MSTGNRTPEVDSRYGPYRVARGLVRAPGAWLVEGRDDNDVRFVLQLARCKPATDPDAKRERQEYVRMIEAASQHLGADPDIELISHGATDEPDGSLMLYWVLPWVDGAETLGRGKVDTAEQLYGVGTALLEKMERRHERGRLAPNLSEQILIVRRRRPVVTVGLPIHLPPGWLTSDVPAPRLAPEERDRAEPRLSGDLWRVGRTLRALGAHITDWPPALKKVVDRMDAESVGDRFRDVSSALIEVESLQSTMAGSRPANIEEPPLPRAAERDVTRATGPQSSPGLRSLMDAPPVGNKEAATVRVELSEDERRQLFGPDQPTELPSEPPRAAGESAAPLQRPQERAMETVIDQPAPQAPQAPPMRRSAGEEATLQDVSMQALADADATAQEADVAPAEPKRRTVWDKADAEAPLPTKPLGPKGTVVGVRLINEPTGLRGDAKMPAILPPPVGTPHPDIASDPRVPEPAMLPPPQPVAPLAGPADAPMLPGPPVMGAPLPGMPPGYAPHLPVPPVSGPAHGAPEGLLPGVSPMGAGAPSMSPAADSGSGYAPPPRPVAEDRPAPAAPDRSGIGVLVGLVLFVAGIAATIAAQAILQSNARKSRSGRRVPTQIFPINAAAEVLLTSAPEDALVVSEVDGRILGSTPMRFLVPNGTDHAVLVTAPGHEPVRVVLPGRGHLKTKLVALDARPPCRVAVKSPTGKMLEGVAATVQPGELYTIQGAAVLRDPKARGAWLVRCPELGGRSAVVLPPRNPPARHVLSILAPQDAELAINGQPSGKVPFRGELRAGFVRVSARPTGSSDVERWIPVFGTTQVQMPNPRPAPTEPK